MFWLGHQKSPMAPFFVYLAAQNAMQPLPELGTWVHMSSMTEKGKIVPKPLESDPKVTHIIFFPHLHSSLCSFLTLYKFSDFSVPEILAATGHSKTVLPVCSPHLLTFPSKGFVRCTVCVRCEQPHYAWQNLMPPSQYQVPCQTLESTSRHPKDTTSKITPQFSQQYTVIYIMCRGLSLSRYKELSYPENLLSFENICLLCMKTPTEKSIWFKLCAFVFPNDFSSLILLINIHQAIMVSSPGPRPPPCMWCYYPWKSGVFCLLLYQPDHAVSWYEPTKHKPTLGSVSRTLGGAWKLLFHFVSCQSLFSKW